ncbi:MAG: c-type cytochrome [Gammaproteobacteria bacterium]
MRSFLRTILFIIALSLFVSSAGFAAGNPEQGKVKAETCLGCHGVPSYTNVYPTYHVPRLGGQHAEYIVAALKGYQSGERSHGTMQAQASGLSEADMADIAAYFQSLQ